MFATRIHRRHMLAGATALAGSTLLPAGLGAQGLTKVRYVTPFGFIIGFAESLYAKTGGFFQKNGLDVEIEGGRGSAMSVQQVTAGNALLSRTGGTDLIKAFAKESSIVAIAEIYQRDIFHVISAAEKPIKTPADMAGKTIGIVSTGGATENLLDMMLASHDIAPDQVKRETVGNAPAAFEFVKRGRIEAFIATNDTVFSLQTDKQPIFSFSTDQYAPAPGQVYMTSKATLEKQTESLAKFLRGVHESIGAMLQKKDDLGPVINSMTGEFELAETKRPDKGIPVLRNALDQTFAAPYRDKLASDPAKWQAAYKLMVKSKIVTEIPDTGFYDDRARKLAFG